MSRERGQSSIETALLIFFICFAVYFGIKSAKSGIQTVFWAHQHSMCNNSPWDCRTGKLLVPCPADTVGPACDE